MSVTHVRWFEDHYELVSLEGYNDTSAFTPIPDDFHPFYSEPDFEKRVFEHNVDRAKADRLAELAAKRWDWSQIFVFGEEPAWAAPALNNLTTKITTRQTLGVDKAETYKLFDGRFEEMTTEQMLAYGEAINEFVQKCFDREAVLAAKILEAETLKEVLAVRIKRGWP